MKKHLFGIIGVVIAAVSLIVFFFAPFGGLAAYLAYEPPEQPVVHNSLNSTETMDIVHYGGMVIAAVMLLLMALFIRRAFEGEAKPLRGVVICALCFTVIPWIW